MKVVIVALLAVTGWSCEGQAVKVKEAKAYCESFTRELRKSGHLGDGNRLLQSQPDLPELLRSRGPAHGPNVDILADYNLCKFPVSQGVWHGSSRAGGDGGWQWSLQ